MVPLPLRLRIPARMTEAGWYGVMDARACRCKTGTARPLLAANAPVEPKLDLQQGAARARRARWGRQIGPLPRAPPSGGRQKWRLCVPRRAEEEEED